jgi:hypothetical protein
MNSTVHHLSTISLSLKKLMPVCAHVRRRPLAWAMNTPGLTIRATVQTVMLDMISETGEGAARAPLVAMQSCN